MSSVFKFVLNCFIDLRKLFGDRRRLFSQDKMFDSESVHVSDELVAFDLSFLETRQLLIRHEHGEVVQ